MSTNQKIDFQTAATYHRRWNSFLAMWYQVDYRWGRLASYKNVKKHPELVSDLSITTLRGLLDRLKEFASKQFAFFYDGFIGNQKYSFGDVDQIEYLNPQFQWLRSDYSIGDFILSEIFDRATFDLQVIDQAIDQRFMAVTTFDWDKIEKWQKQGIDQVLSIHRTINTADELAIGAMLLFSTSLRVDRFATAITYQRSSATLRVIPYADVALIGLPISTLGNDEDILAIPHEVGHFLYWNGEKQVGDKTLTLRNWLKQELSPEHIDHPWLEEIVADVVSCIIGGPITTYSLMRHLQKAVGKSFLYDDGEHPIPAIRPYVCLRILDKKLMTPQKVDIAAKLRNTWEEILAKRKIDLENVAPVSHRQNGEDVNSTTLSKLIAEDGDLYKLVDRLCELIDVDNVQNSLLWYSDELDYSQVTTDFIQRVREKAQSSLRTSIMNAVNNSKKHINPSLEINNPKTFWSDYIEELFVGHDSSAAISEVLQDYLDNAQAVNVVNVIESVDLPKEIPANEWLTIFDAGGWTTGGDGPTNFKKFI